MSSKDSSFAEGAILNQVHEPVTVRESLEVPIDWPVDRIVAVIPAYNEERFIGSVVLKARRFAAKVIVVDDGSLDATALVAAEAGVIVIQHECNRGKGAALTTGLQAAQQFDPQVVVMLDADGQHLPEEIRQVVAPVLAGQADVVIGSRYLEKHSQVPRRRILGHQAFNLITRLASGVNASDSQSGFRAFSPRAVEAFAFYSNGFSVESEMQFIAHELGLHLLEVPITIRYLDPPKRSVWLHGMTVLNGILHLVGQYRPLLFFGLPGLILLVFGILWGVWVAEIYYRGGQLAVGYALGSVLLMIIGLIMLSTGFTLHSVRGLLMDMLNKKDSK